jgi:phosphatidylserine/phosphatidylglycerophosphate/cardiolipin synthase-like enzyme
MRHDPDQGHLFPAKARVRHGPGPAGCSQWRRVACVFHAGAKLHALIVEQINGAQSELLVQAYGFTSPEIIQAIGRAKERGVDVNVILDRVNEQDRYTGATYLLNHGIDPLIDDRVVIAHNKIMVIDDRNVITGSFNFTKAAQRNAENILFVIDDMALAAAYKENWMRRAAASWSLGDFRAGRPRSRRSPKEE